MYGESNERQLCWEIAGAPVSMELEIVRVVSLSTTEISEIIRFKIRSSRSEYHKFCYFHWSIPIKMNGKKEDWCICKKYRLRLVCAICADWSWTTLCIIGLFFNYLHAKGHSGPYDSVDWFHGAMNAMTCLALSQTNPGLYVSSVQVFWKHCAFGELSAVFIQFKECKLCHLGKSCASKVHYAPPPPPRQIMPYLYYYLSFNVVT